MQLDKQAVLSLGDCEKIVKEFSSRKEFQVLDYNVFPFSENVDGFLGEHLLLKITIWSEGKSEELRFFAKRFPFGRELQTEFALSVGAFATELFTYEVLFKEFNKFQGFDVSFAPKYYYGKENDLLVFEDLSLKGFTTLRNINEVSLDHIKTTLEALAKFHAGSIGYQELKTEELGKKYRLTDDYEKYLQEKIFYKDDNFLGYKYLKSRLGALMAAIDELPAFCDINGDCLKDEITKLFEKTFEIIKPKKYFYNVISHGDMWFKNVMYRYENSKPVECKIVDFQLERYSPPAHDVLQYIYLTVSAEERRYHLDGLLRYYHKCLTKELCGGNIDIDEILPYKDFEASVHYLSPQIKLSAAFQFSFHGANPEFYKKITSQPECFNEFSFLNGAPFTIELLKTDQNFRKGMSQLLLEIKELVMRSRRSSEHCFDEVTKLLNLQGLKLDEVVSA